MNPEVFLFAQLYRNARMDYMNTYIPNIWNSTNETHFRRAYDLCKTYHIKIEDFIASQFETILAKSRNRYCPLPYQLYSLNALKRYKQWERERHQIKVSKITVTDKDAYEQLKHLRELTQWSDEKIFEQFENMGDLIPSSFIRKYKMRVKNGKRLIL